MKERPILFNGPMVRAILDGRKTQTRRVIKGLEFLSDDDGNQALVEISRVNGEFPPHWVAFHSDYPDEGCTEPFQCPYGELGDQLWVRETWSPDHRAFYPHFPKVFRADEPTVDDAVANCRNRARTDEAIGRKHSPIEGCACEFRWRPSIHMPRWASRITLEITGVRVERLKEISEEDARAEGGDPVEVDATDSEGKPVPPNHALGFAWLWDSLPGTGPRWDDNPWVWVLEFKRIQP